MGTNRRIYFSVCGARSYLEWHGWNSQHDPLNLGCFPTSMNHWKLHCMIQHLSKSCFIFHSGSCGIHYQTGQVWDPALPLISNGIWGNFLKFRILVLWSVARYKLTVALLLLAGPEVPFSYHLMFSPLDRQCIPWRLRLWWILPILPFQPHVVTTLAVRLMLHVGNRVCVLSEVFLPKRQVWILGPICSNFTGLLHSTCF